MEKNIAILTGDGIGPEVISEALKVLKAVEEFFGHKFNYTYGLVGGAAIEETGDPYPDTTHSLCMEANAILFGAIGHPRYDNDPAARVRPEQGLLKMRKKLGLFANIRPVRSYSGLSEISPLKSEKIKDVDLIIFRELTGGIYFGTPRGRSEDGNTAFDTCTYSREEILRITALAFEAARKRRSKITLVDKANVLSTSRLWRETVTDFAEQNQDVEFDCMFVDNAAMQLIQNPKQFDVILTENLFGDILTDEASVITCSLGMLPSASVGSDVSLYEPVHGSYPQVTGQNKANPVAAVLSAAMMLEYSFGLQLESNTILEAVEICLNKGFVTEDLNKNKYLTTSEIGDKISGLIYSGKILA